VWSAEAMFKEELQLLYTIARALREER